LASVVSARGFDCSDYKPTSSTSTVTVGNLPKGDRGTCTIDGEHSNLSVYKTSDDLKAVVGALPTIGCAFAKGLGTPTLRFVVGSTWSISTPSSATGPKLAKALGAKAVTYNCK
jgi:hypothetical protein